MHTHYMDKSIGTPDHYTYWSPFAAITASTLLGWLSTRFLWECLPFHPRSWLLWRRSNSRLDVEREGREPIQKRKGQMNVTGKKARW